MASSSNNPDSGSDPPNPQDRSRHSNLSRISRLEDAKNLIYERRKEAAAFSRDNGPYIRDQIHRVNASYSPPWYCAFTSAEYRLSALEESMTYMCSEGGRVMTDSEAAAFSEKMLGAMDSQTLLRFSVMTAAATMTARGARRFRFPFFTPQFKNSAISPVGGGLALTWGWHSLRFAAYYVVLRMTVEAPLGAYSVATSVRGLGQDPRMSDFYTLVKSKSMSGQGFEGPHKSYDQQERQAAGQNNESFAQEPDYNSEKVARRTAPTWASYRQRAQEESSQSSPQTQDQYQPYEPGPYSPTAQPQTRSSLWDTPSVTQDVDDDASPIAPSFRKQQRGSSSPGGGSAWDRVRKQAEADNVPSSQPAARSPWPSGESDDRQSGYYKNDESSAGRGQAQRQFDELLEKERQAGEDGPSDNQAFSKKW